jgi:hypothetical protein
MNVQDRVLVLDRIEVIHTLQNNPDKSPKSEEIKKSLIDMVLYYRKLSEKQYSWLLSKLKYVLNNNVPFRKEQGIDRYSFDDFWIWPDSTWPLRPHLRPEELN